MDTNVAELLYPKSASKEISFMFYNYKKINKLIENRRETIMDRMNGSTRAWLKGINQSSNSFEDIIIKLDEDRVINRYKHWNEFLSSFFNILKTYERPIYYRFIVLKYFKNLDNEEIMEILNVNKNQLRNIKTKVIWLTYQYAIKDKLFEMEVQNNVAV